MSQKKEYVKAGRTRVLRNTRTEVIQDRSTRTEKERDAVKQELEDEMDDILDDIDSVLESNAETFVNSYVQKGGE